MSESLARVLQTDRAGDRREHRFAVAGGGQVDEEDAVLEAVDLRRQRRAAPAASCRSRRGP